MLEGLTKEVLAANLRLVDAGLVVLTWGNASGFDPDKGLVVIKPSGVDYATMKTEDLVVVDLDGRVVEGACRPSSDTPTHLEFYRNFKGVRGAVHTHSVEAMARMARLTEQLAAFRPAAELPAYVGEKHFQRKHGPNAYYGQGKVAV